MTPRSRNEIRIRRVYDGLQPDDGKRFLIDRLWPRGISKSALASAEWLRDVAPSAELREWFQHDPDKWLEFQNRYRLELRKNKDAWMPLLEALRTSDVTLLFATRNLENNHAIVLKRFLEQKNPLAKAR